MFEQSKATPVIIFSDLDGTLLDHYTYKSTEALPIIAQLNSAQVPIVLTTSKTLAEVISIQKNLNIKAPLIIENGAAVLFPKNMFAQQPKDTTEKGDYWVKSFCSSQDHWLSIIEKAPADFKGLFQGFSTLSLEELVKITGLSADDAKLAKHRQYGEPIHWLGNEQKKSEFIQYLEKSGATVLHGGRFFHVSGESDKGKALNWLTQSYKDMFTIDKILTIALGDGKNDIAMLEAANIAVQIRSPVHNFPSLNKQDNLIQTEKYGPAGWAESLEKLLPNPLPIAAFSTN